MSMGIRPVIVLVLFYLILSGADDCQYQTSAGILDLRTLGYPNRPKFTGVPDSDRLKLLSYSFNGCFSYSTKDQCQNAAACVSE